MLARHLILGVVALVVVLGGVAPASAQDLRLPAVFGDHMVLQRGLPVAVWGWAAPGETVRVSFKAHAGEARADDTGAWRVNLPALDADAEPAELTVTSGDQTVVVGDVLVGEVWLCSGQSNMEWQVVNSDDAEREIAEADWPLIRHISAPRRPSMTPMDDVEAAWEVCSPETVGDFTAVGYFFGRRLHRELDVPIGLINCTWGGTRIEPWVPLAGFGKAPQLAELYEQVLARQPAGVPYRRAASEYVEAMRAWAAEAQREIAAGEPVSEPAAFPEQLRPYTDRQDPTTLYNGMMRPFVPYTIRGAIWYQGESNSGEGMMYLHKTRALVEGWREAWGRPDLPYYFVQIAPYHYGQTNPTVLPAFWEAQAAIEKEVPHTGMVVIHDIGNVNDIHPRNKQDVGLRLANRALRHDYGRDDLLASGPRFASMEADGGRLLLTFEHAGEGLRSRDGAALSWFEVAGEAEPWTEATAEVVAPDTVAVSAEGIDRPVAVRLGWHKLAEPNLVNSAGLPVAPFRAGEPPALGVMALNVPESRGYELIYDLDLDKLGQTEVTYDADRAEAFVGAFDRVAYFLELTTHEGETRWAYVSMDAFTADLGKIGVPTLGSGARFQQGVSNLVVASNVWGVPNGEGWAGHLEFWPNNYGRSNAAGVPGASDSAYDTGDQISTETPDGYGSMQVHVVDPAVTVFAVNHWKTTPSDVGIGNNGGGGEPDWTFTGSGDRYASKRLRVLVRPAGR